MYPNLKVELIIREYRKEREKEAGQLRSIKDANQRSSQRGSAAHSIAQNAARLLVWLGFRRLRQDAPNTHPFSTRQGPSYG